MNIVFVNPFFPPWAPGGAEHSLEQMCLHFSKKGWNVQVLAAAFDDRALDEQRSDYWVRWIRAPYTIMPGQNVEAEDYFRTNHFHQSILDRFSALKQPDVIIANNSQVFGVVRDLGKKFKIPTIGIIRDTQLLCEFGACMDNISATKASPCVGFLGAAVCSIKFQRVRGEAGWRPIPAWSMYGFQMHTRRLRMRLAVQQFDHVITISNALNMLIRRGLPALGSNRMTTVRNFSTQVKAIDKLQVTSFLDQHALVPGRFFLFAGRKTYGKGVDVLVAANAIAQEAIPDCQSLLLGRGEVSAAKGSNCVDAGSVSQSLLLGLLRQAAALVIPGRWQEGLHRTMIDAIKIGIPIICTEAGAPSVDGVEHGKNGMVCCCGDPSALATSMIDVLNWNDDERDKCRDASGRIFQQRFSDNVHMDNWSRILNKYIKCEK